MPQVTADMTITLDGYGSGVGQSAERPFGDLDPDRLHSWMFDHAEENAEERAAITWGEDPPYHAPVFVLAHRPRESVEMEGGTVFHFVTEGIEAAMALAREAAGDRDVSIAGGPGTTNQYLAADLIDELGLHVAPFVAGRGERMFDDAAGIELRPVSSRATPHVTHLVYRR